VPKDGALGGDLRRVAVVITEEGLNVAPSDFWNEELLSKIEEIAKRTIKTCKADSTIIVMPVKDRSEPGNKKF